MPGEDGKVSPQRLLDRCAVEGLSRVFLEGGGKLAASFIKSGLVDTIEWFRAPILIGGDGLPAVAALGLVRDGRCAALAHCRHGTDWG